MSTNYKLVLASEKKLKKLVFDFISFCYETHKCMWEKIWERKEFFDVFDWVNKRVLLAQEMERDLVDECIWIISKDSPRANHLRIIISFIYQTKDIERAINYASSIMKTISRTSISLKELEMIKDLIEKYLKTMKELISLYDSKVNSSKFETSEIIVSNFSDFAWSINKPLKSKIKDDLHDDDKYFLLYTIMKNIENSIGRLKNIFHVIYPIKEN
ncbi:MAG: hypothetical protein ACRDAW_02860 [Metamycoplasmataceae bacterium]